MTIRLRIILGFLLIVGAGFYYLTTWVLDEIRPHYLKSMEESLVDQAVLLASTVSAGLTGDSIPTAGLRQAFDHAARRRFEARIYDVVKTRTNVRVYVTDSAGIVVFDSDGGRDEGRDYSQWNDVYRTLRGGYGARATRAQRDDPLSSSLYVAAPVMAGERIAGVLTVVKPSGSVDAFVLQARGKLIAAAVVAAACVVALGVLLSLWVTLPLRRVTAYARAVRDGRRAALPRLSGESAVMGAALEEMRTALEGKAYVEQYVQTLTHELKSPLSAIKAAGELLQEELPAERRAQFAGNVQAESARIQAVVDRMLELASVESRRELRDVEAMDLVEIVAAALDSLTAAFERKGVRLDRRMAGPATVRGERFLLRQAVANLVQNALDFTPAGGTVTVAVQVRDGLGAVVVEDTGPGIPAYALPRAFERFYSLPRPDSGRKSTGLGLNFVRQVAELHGGTASLANRAEGGAHAELAVLLA